MCSSAVLVSDGSAAWIISSANERKWKAGDGSISGEVAVQSAYTSELGGNTAGADAPDHISWPENMPQVPITIALDGQEALKM